MARQFGKAQQHLRMLQAVPAVEQDIRGYDRNPCGLQSQGKDAEGAYTKKTNHHDGQQARARPITNQSKDRNICPPSSGKTGRRLKISRPKLMTATLCSSKYASGIACAYPNPRNERPATNSTGTSAHIDKRTRGDAPERGARPLRGIDVGDAAERPQDNLICQTSDLTAGQGVAEFMEHDNEKQCQVLRRVPEEGRVRSLSAADLVRGDKKPRPMERHLDATEMEQV